MANTIINFTADVEMNLTNIDIDDLATAIIRKLERGIKLQHHEIAELEKLQLKLNNILENGK